MVVVEPEIERGKDFDPRGSQIDTLDSVQREWRFVTPTISSRNANQVRCRVLARIAKPTALVVDVNTVRRQREWDIWAPELRDTWGRC